MAPKHAIGGMDGQHWDTVARCSGNGLFLADDPLVIGPAAVGHGVFFHQVHPDRGEGLTLVSLCRSSDAAFISRDIRDFRPLVSGWPFDSVSR